MQHELLSRYQHNPILTYKDLPFLCNAIYNPGATKYGAQYVLMPRVENGKRDNALHVAFSSDGIHFTVQPEPIQLEPVFDGIPEKHMYDPRITKIEDTYYITYCSQNFDEVVRIGLLKTLDFKHFERIGYITQPWSRNCALFPEKINGLYCRVERPMNGSDSFNMVSYSPDLIHWGQFKPLNIEPQTWFRQKWGIGPSPKKTDAGWLVVIHGVWLAVNYVYRLGVILLDLNDPSKVVGQCPDFILTPREDYERNGETINCVFCNGAVPEDDGTIKFYYGAADTCIGLATANTQELINACLQKV